MPIYEFLCAECGEKYVVHCKLEQRRTKCKCAMCGGAAKLVISAPNFQIKGYAPGRDIRRGRAPK